MSELVIHIGMPKTGSSSIQETLYCKGEHAGYTYADLGTPNHGGVVRSGFSLDISPEKRKSALKALTAVRDQGGFQIVSGEAVYHMNESALIRMRDFFRGSFDTIKIVGYVRAPASFMASSFVQLVKNHELATLDLNRLWPRYREKLEKFDRVFGDNQVILKPFIQDLLVDGDVVQDFCHTLGQAIEPRLIQRVNESLSLEATAALFIYRKVGPKYKKYQRKNVDNNALVEALGGFGLRKLKFSRSLVNPLIERNYEDVKWVENRLGQSICDDGGVDAEAISKEQDIVDAGVGCISDLEMFVKGRQAESDLTPQQIANWAEKLRVCVTGRATNGARYEVKEHKFLTDEQKFRIMDDQVGPAAALRELAVAFERSNRLKEAYTCVRAAMEIRPDAQGLLGLRERINKKIENSSISKR